MSALNVENRHPAVKQIARWLDWEQMPAGKTRNIAMSCHRLAREVLEDLPDDPELVAGLRKLVEARDCFVRAAIADAEHGATTGT